MSDKQGAIGGKCKQTWEQVNQLEAQSVEQSLMLCVEAKDRDVESYPWTTNGKRFGTAAEAVEYGRDLASRWMALTNWQVAVSDTPRAPVAAEATVDESTGQSQVSGAD